jgi:hypothetical protein
MRTETITKTLFKFEELTKENQQKEIEKNRYWNVNGGYNWWDGVYENVTQIAEIFGIDLDNIWFSGFWSQGDGACFEGAFYYNKGMVKSIKSYAPKDKELHRIAKEIQSLHRAAFYTAGGRIRHRGHYYHERSMDVECSQEKGREISWKEWKDVFADFATWIYRSLENEYEYLTSDEAIAESLKANEVEFEIDEDEDICW